jgi:hypothetical protein
MGNDKRLFAYTLHFSSRILDERRMRMVLERSFGARDIRWEHTPLAAELNPRPLDPNWRPNPGTLAARVFDLLQDGKARRLVEIVAATENKSVASTIVKLVTIGAVVKIARGCYARAGSQPGETPIPARRLGSALQRVYDLLVTPKTAVELREILLVSRQAVDQHLKRLIRRELVRRVPAIGDVGQHVYLRTGDRVALALRERTVKLGGNAARLLSTLPPDAPVRLVDLIGRGPSSMTLRETMDFDQPSLEILLTIYALGAARSIDLTLCTGIGRYRKGKGAGMGNYVQRLEDVGFLGIVNSAADGHPQYCLTKAGLAYVNTLRGLVKFPQATKLRQRLGAARAKYRGEQSARSLSAGSRGPGRRLVSIVTLLRQRGPLPTTEINALLPEPYPNPKSINLAMQMLCDRGEVIVKDRAPGRAIMWSVPSVEQVSQHQLPEDDATTDGRHLPAVAAIAARGTELG